MDDLSSPIFLSKRGVFVHFERLISSSPSPVGQIRPRTAPTVGRSGREVEAEEMSGNQSPTSLSRTVERVFDDSQYTGEIILSGRKLKLFPHSAAKYDLVDTTLVGTFRSVCPGVRRCFWVSLRLWRYTKRLFREYLAPAIIGRQVYAEIRPTPFHKMAIIEERLKQ